jgi:hypothetical protein
MASIKHFLSSLLQNQKIFEIKNTNVWSTSLKLSTVILLCDAKPTSHTNKRKEVKSRHLSAFKHTVRQQKLSIFRSLAPKVYRVFVFQTSTKGQEKCCRLIQQYLSIWIDEHGGVIKVLTQDKSRGRKQGIWMWQEQTWELAAGWYRRRWQGSASTGRSSRGSGSFAIPLLLLRSNETRDEW